MYYVARCIERMIEEDNYKKGCIGKSWLTDFHNTVSDKDLAYLIHKIGVYHDTTIDIDCVIDDYIHVSVLENPNGDKANKAEIERWKDDKIKLYDVCYIYEITKQIDVTSNELIEVLK